MVAVSVAVALSAAAAEQAPEGEGKAALSEAAQPGPSFRDESGHAEPRCILSTLVRRSVVEDFDWENDTATSFVELNNARFDANRDGAVKVIQPLEWQEAQAAVQEATKIIDGEGPGRS